MWNIQKNIIKENKIIQYHIFEKDNLLSRKEVIHLWKDNPEFRIFYNNILIDSEFSGFFWEHPPSTKNDLEKDYEFVLISSSILNNLQPDIHSFQEHFTDDNVIHFSNLGGDAQLIVPTPKMDNHNYTHLAKFVRNAPLSQIHDFWKLVGEIYLTNLGEKQKWLSTAGLGVFWLHIRVDSRPKYYKYSQYK